MMPSASQDAAGLPEPTMTSLIALPMHQPPNIERSQMITQRHAKGSICRNFTSDTWLYNTTRTTNADLGRIISNDAIDERTDPRLLPIAESS